MALLEGHGGRELLPSLSKHEGSGATVSPPGAWWEEAHPGSKPSCRIQQLHLSEQVFTKCVQTLINSPFTHFGCLFSPHKGTLLTENPPAKFPAHSKYRVAKAFQLNASEPLTQTKHG